MTARPISVTVIAFLFIVVGTLGFIEHIHTLAHAAAPPQREGILIEVTELLAILAGAFMLRRQNWARWLALAWMAFHVVIGALNSFSQAAIHTLLLALIAWCLFNPEANRYFRRD
jgi:hypothetical protein